MPELVIGHLYDTDALEFVGWSDGRDHPEYNYLDWFGPMDAYLGPDSDGLEPIVDNIEPYTWQDR